MWPIMGSWGSECGKDFSLPTRNPGPSLEALPCNPFVFQCIKNSVSWHFGKLCAEKHNGKFKLQDSRTHCRSCCSFCRTERAVRLGDAPTFNYVERGARPRGRAEVRFLTSPPTLKEC